MPIGRQRTLLDDIFYHRDRMRQEARLIRAARSLRAAEIHTELMLLHQKMRDRLVQDG